MFIPEPDDLTTMYFTGFPKPWKSNLLASLARPGQQHQEVSSRLSTSTSTWHSVCAAADRLEQSALRAFTEFQPSSWAAFIYLPFEHRIAKHAQSLQ